MKCPSKIKIILILTSILLFRCSESPDQKDIIGNNYKGIALREDKLALFVYNTEIRPYFKHELFHLIAYSVWGESKSAVLEEGGAMFTDNECLLYENPVTVINRYLYEKDKWFGFEELAINFREKAPGKY